MDHSTKNMKNNNIEMMLEEAFATYTSDLLAKSDDWQAMLKAAALPGACGGSSDSPVPELSPSSSPLNTGNTVSPAELYQNPFSPPSTVFTNLTSPSVGNSPFNECIDASPLLSSCDNQNMDWFSLFPDPVIRTADMSSLLAQPQSQTHVSNTIESEISLPMNDNVTGATMTPTTATSPPTSDGSESPSCSNDEDKTPIVLTSRGISSPMCGVSKSRRRKGPLPPIKVDPSDKVALKRARNTLAARDSRQRKLDHLKFLESRIAQLEDENSKWKTIAIQHGYTGPL